MKLFDKIYGTRKHDAELDQDCPADRVKGDPERGDGRVDNYETVAQFYSKREGTVHSQSNNAFNTSYVLLIAGGLSLRRPIMIRLLPIVCNLPIRFASLMFGIPIRPDLHLHGKIPYKMTGKEAFSATVSLAGSGLFSLYGAERRSIGDKYLRKRFFYENFGR